MSRQPENERIVELPWLVARLGQPRRLLDVGHADAAYSMALLATGAEVILQDVRPFSAPAAARRIIGPPPWPVEAGSVDLITCVSVLDHVGLDAYGQAADPGAMPALLAELRRVAAPGARLLVTVPVGRDLWTTHPGGGQRVFSRDALAALLDGWAWVSATVYRDSPAGYVLSTWDAVADAGYLGYRAEAVACIEAVRP